MIYPSVTLEPNSLYIFTQSINSPISTPPVDPTAYHWGFLITGNSGGSRVVKHHWNVEENESEGAHVERYRMNSIWDIATQTTERGFYLVFARVQGWQDPFPGDVSAQTFRKVFSQWNDMTPGVLRKQTPVVSCRTWSLEVVKSMVEHRFIVHPDGDAFTPAHVEETIQQLCEEAMERLCLQYDDDAETTWSSSVVII